MTDRAPLPCLGRHSGCQLPGSCQRTPCALQAGQICCWAPARQICSSCSLHLALAWAKAPAGQPRESPGTAPAKLVSLASGLGHGLHRSRIQGSSSSSLTTGACVVAVLQHAAALLSWHQAACLTSMQLSLRCMCSNHVRSACMACQLASMPCSLPSIQPQHAAEAGQAGSSLVPTWLGRLLLSCTGESAVSPLHHSNPSGQGCLISGWSLMQGSKPLLSRLWLPRSQPLPLYLGL